MVVLIFKLVFEFLEGVIIAQIAGPSEFMILALVGKAMLSKSLIQLSANRRGCVPSLLVLWPKVAQSWSLQALW